MHTQVEEPLSGSRGLVLSEGKGDPDVSQCDASWVPVLTYAQEGPAPGAHSVLTMDVAQHGYVASSPVKCSPQKHICSGHEREKISEVPPLSS